MTITTTPINSTVAANVRHHIGTTAPSTVGEWLNITTTDAIRLLDGEQSFTVDQLATITRRTGVHVLGFVLTPGQNWGRELRSALTNPTMLETPLWTVLGSMAKRTDLLGNESVHHARELVTDALQMLITGQGERADIVSKIRGAIMALNAV